MTKTIDAQALADLRSYVFAREIFERAYSVHLAAVEAVMAEYTEGKRDLADQLNRIDVLADEYGPNLLEQKTSMDVLYEKLTRRRRTPA